MVVQQMILEMEGEGTLFLEITAVTILVVFLGRVLKEIAVLLMFFLEIIVIIEIVDLLMFFQMEGM